LPDNTVIMANLGWPPPSADDRPVDGSDPAGAGTGSALAAVRRAVADGARMVDLGPATATAMGSAIESIRALEPEVIICADVPGADLTRDPAIAHRTGAALLRTPAGAAPSARASAAAPSARASAAPGLIEAGPVEVASLIAAGWPVLVDADARELPATIAVASVCAWLGARIVRTRHVAAIRQALEMVESVRGTRAPSVARRGLA
jgi:hypothetical protein